MTTADRANPVLVAYDGSPASRDALQGALAILRPAPMIVLTVWEQTSAGVRRSLEQAVFPATGELVACLDAEAEAAAEATAREGADIAAAAGWEAKAATEPAARTAMLEHSLRWRAILCRADQEKAALVVLGAGGHSRAPIMGSVAYGVVHHARVPALVAPPRAHVVGDGPLLAAYDGSDHARFALEAASQSLAARRVLVLSVWQSAAPTAAAARVALPDAVVREGIHVLDRAAEQEARRTAKQGAQQAHSAGLISEPLTARADESVSGAIVEHARERAASAIVIGTRGRSG